MFSFSDGTIRWYDDTKGQDEKGVFIGAINKEDGADKKSESTNDVAAALPCRLGNDQGLKLDLQFILQNTLS